MRFDGKEPVVSCRDVLVCVVVVLITYIVDDTRDRYEAFAMVCITRLQSCE